MSKNDVENEGAKPRDHDHSRHHFLKHLHTDWRVWTAVVLMIALIFVYVMTADLSLRPNKAAGPPIPAANAP
jgi:hypothetical protein